MGVTRRAEVGWDGDLASGSGIIRYVSSGSISRLPVTWAARTEAHDGRTSPEELIAAAHASCFSMALSAQLGERGITAPAIETTCTVTFENLTLTKSVLKTTVKARGAPP